MMPGMATAVREPAQARGIERRGALLDAAIRLLARQGARAVTLRAVAEEAGATHGAPRYYFATREALLDEALKRLAARQVEEVERLLSEHGDSDPEGGAARLAAHLAGPLAQDRDGTIARYELFLEAARRPQLRPALEAWGKAYERLLAAQMTANSPDPKADAELLLNLLNGLLLRQAALPRRDFETAVLRPAIQRFSS
jgi:AcrR family transcriptional regulator